MDIKAMADSRGTIMNFDPRKLKIKPGLNARDMSDPETIAHIEWLTESIMANGFKPSHPIEIFSEGEEIYVAHGHCRLTAAMQAISRGLELKTVTCVPEPKGTNDVARILTQNLDNSGKRLTPMEEAYNVKRAIDLGASEADVARKLGKSSFYVSHALELMAAPEALQNMIRAGEISASLAVQTVREEGSGAVETVKEAVAVAKSQGKKKATAKHLKPLKPKAKKSGRPLYELELRPMPQGEFMVRFGETPIVLTRKQWANAAAKILEAIGGITSEAGQDEEEISKTESASERNRAERKASGQPVFRPGSKRDKLDKLLRKGVTAEAAAAMTGWTRGATVSALLGMSGLVGEKVIRNKDTDVYHYA
jgi:hypothetical protein